MPLGRHKVPFSGKAKKQQLKEKKQRQLYKNEFLSQTSSKNFLVKRPSESDKEDELNVLSVNEQPSDRRGSRNPNRYNLRFHRETEAEIKERKEQARKAIVSVGEENLEINIDDFFPRELDFPVRPPWEFTMSREELDARENRYFSEYLKNIEDKYNWSDLSYFELNLETWRQLWRVLEMADIVLLITDIRFPALMLPPSLYNYVIKTLQKHLIVVLNKIDLVPSSLVVAWKHYLKSRYPGIHIVMFTSYPSYNLRNYSSKTEGLQVKKRKGKMRMAAEGAQKLFDACKDIVKNKVDLTSWQEKISEEMSIEHDIGEEVEIAETINLKTQDTSYHRHKMYEGGILTIGCVGQPNVGKSSLMNALMGRKVVSVSRTPGHTKHFQTIFLTNTVKLCDCPGLVFPSKVPKSLQVLMGSFPIAQLREPYSCVQFLAERVDLITMLKIQHPEQGEDEWSAMDICDGWAIKKGFFTARTARPDSYRAANHLLRMALEGKIPFSMRPPGYTEFKEKWSTNPDIQLVEWIQAATQGEAEKVPDISDYESDEEEDDSRPHGDSESHGTKTQSSSEEEFDNENLKSLNKFEALNVTE